MELFGINGELGAVEGRYLDVSRRHNVINQVLNVRKAQTRKFILMQTFLLNSPFVQNFPCLRKKIVTNYSSAQNLWDFYAMK